MSSLIDVLAAELERPREITAQVIRHLGETYGLSREAVGAFLTSELANLEDYEVDLILAPLFTPTLSDQQPIAEFLGAKSVPQSDWPALIQQLLARPTRAEFITEDGVHHHVTLREVAVERYVYRLRLDGTIASEVQAVIDKVSAGESELLEAIARRAIWENAERREILRCYVENSASAFRAEDAVALLKLAEIYEPASVADLLGRIPHWQQALQQEINAGGGKPFFNERVEELHGGGRDQRRQDQIRLGAKEQELDFLTRLSETLSTAN
jgi:hypothetical protein